MAFCSALTSSAGPTIRDVPVSTIAWQLVLQRVSWLPTSTLQGRLEREQRGGAERQYALVYSQHLLYLLSRYCDAAFKDQENTHLNDTVILQY